LRKPETPKRGQTTRENEGVGGRGEFGAGLDVKGEMGGIGRPRGQIEENRYAKGALKLRNRIGGGRRGRKKEEGLIVRKKKG